MDNSKIKILVVDDEQGLCAGLQEGLRREGYLVDAANDAPAARATRQPKPLQSGDFRCQNAGRWAAWNCWRKSASAAATRCSF